MANVVTSPARGTRDFLPADMRRRDFVMSRVRDVYQRYGFEPLETPSMERLETLLGKYGEEGDQLIFRLLHRGDKLKELVAAGKLAENDLADMALRYDLTVPLARVAAEYQSALPRFFKRYQMQPVWRADRPARGRFREFYQCDVDITGSDALVCDVEVASAICDVLDDLGFQDYAVRLNHRGLLRGLIEAAGLTAAQEVDAITALDKLDKIGVDGVKKELAERGITEASATRLLDTALLAQTHKGDDASLLAQLLPRVDASEAGRKAITELQTLLGLAAHAPAGRRFKLDPSLARGLGYYTGPIFEVQVADLPGSLGGGGRYDNLIGMFLGKRVPAVGFSLGLERILVVMEERGMFKALNNTASEVMVLQVEDATAAQALQAATLLRHAGIRTELYPQADKLGKQFQYAEQRGVKLAVFVGSRERDSGVCAVKNLATQQQTLVPAGDLVTHVRQLLAPPASAAAT